jgi:hypothetical protein
VKGVERDKGKEKGGTNRMNANNWVFRLDWFSADKFPVSSRTLSLREARMFSSQAFQQFLDRIRKALVSSNLGHPSGVAPRRRNGEEYETSE